MESSAKIIKSFKSGDIVFIECDGPISDDAAHRLKSYFDSLDTGLKIVILGDRMKVASAQEARLEDAKEYRIVIANSPDVLEVEVNQLMQEGWRLHGGPSVTASSYTYEDQRKGGTEVVSDCSVIQAMVK